MSSVMAYLSNYSSQFLFSVLFGVITSFILTIPIAALLYNRRGRLSFLTLLGIYLSILYAFALIFFTLFPIPENPQQFCQTHHLTPNLDPLQVVADFKKQPRSVVFQTDFNVVFFLPLGFSLKRIFRWNSWGVVIAGFCTSLFIECSQLTGVFGIFPCAYRLFDVDDLITNTVGCICGLLIALLVNKVKPPKPADTTVVSNPGFVRRAVAFVIDSFIVAIAAYTFVVLIAMIVAALSGGHVGFEQITGGDRRNSPLAIIAICASLAVFEWWIPVRHHGQTLAGRFVHMSVETHPRTGRNKILFYAARYAVLVVLFVWEGVNALVGLALLIFYLVKKQMPYDFVPYEGSAAVGTAGAFGTGMSNGTAAPTVPAGPGTPATPTVPIAPQNAASVPLSNPDPTATQTPVTDGSTHNQDSPAHPTV